MKQVNSILGAISVTAMLLGTTVCTAAPVANKAELEYGRYLVKIGGCNDCHTPGYPQNAGNIPESNWLTGNPVAFTGPWGATYPANLRLVIQSMSETEWLNHAHVERRPPMPWFNLAATSDKDLRAMYKFIKSLGAKGEPAPAYIPPGQAVNTPYIEFFPKNLPQHAEASN
jgi:mono/diheme cytochrome c family protein